MSINLNSINISGITMSSGSAPAPTGDVVLQFSEFNPSGNFGGQNLQDPNGTFSSIGFTITDSGYSGVLMAELTSEHIAFFSQSAYRAGYVWTAYWASGSTYVSTPVNMQYSGGSTLVFFIQNPANPSQAVPGGTFNYPAAFVVGTTPIG